MSRPPVDPPIEEQTPEDRLEMRAIADELDHLAERAAAAGGQGAAEDLRTMARAIRRQAGAN